VRVLRHYSDSSTVPTANVLGPMPVLLLLQQPVVVVLEEALVVLVVLVESSEHVQRLHYCCVDGLYTT
jgi:hypothetical protein